MNSNNFLSISLCINYSKKKETKFHYKFTIGQQYKRSSLMRSHEKIHNNTYFAHNRRRSAKIISIQKNLYMHYKNGIQTLIRFLNNQIKIDKLRQKGCA